ncbi:MAG: DUF4277 domain-containing protein [Chloroflexi bacterium]|nr:DUF4277 domain-containing protein [Chloroflexota bacterium]
MPEFTISVERLDDLPLLYGFIEKMGIQSTIDTVIKPHGNWQGLSMGWVISIWLSHIISAYNHRMDRVQEWVATHQVSLRQLTGQDVSLTSPMTDWRFVCGNCTSLTSGGGSRACWVIGCCAFTTCGR